MSFFLRNLLVDAQYLDFWLRIHRRIWLPFAALALVAFCIDMIEVHNQYRWVCFGAAENGAWYCSLQDIQCHAVPVDCRQGEVGWIATYKIYYDEIKPHAPGDMSILGWLWVGILYAVAFAYNTLLLAWYVIKQPVQTNVVFWYSVVYHWRAYIWTGKWAWNFFADFFNLPTFDMSPRQKLASQYAYGDAGLASLPSVHQALIGSGGGGAEPRFRD